MSGILPGIAKSPTFSIYTSAVIRNINSLIFHKVNSRYIQDSFLDYIQAVFLSYIQVVSLLPSDQSPAVSKNGDLLTKPNFQGLAVSKNLDLLTKPKFQGLAVSKKPDLLTEDVTISPTGIQLTQENYFCVNNMSRWTSPNAYPDTRNFQKKDDSWSHPLR